MRVFVGNDYYDGGMKHGFDDHVVFAREKDRFIKGDITVKHNIYAHFFDMQFRSTKDKYYKGSIDPHFAIKDIAGSPVLSPVSVVLCGKHYCGIRIIYNPTNMRPDDPHPIQNYIWSLDELKAWASTYNLIVENDSRSWYHSDKDITLPILKYFDPVTVVNDALQYLIDNRITIMTAIPSPESRRYTTPPTDYIWTVNGFSLRDIKFFKVMDVPTIFQEIEMWIGNVLTTSGNEMLTISDEVRAEKHGLDKWSFRKPPQD